MLMFTKFISIGSYSPEVPAFGTLKNLLSHFTIVNTTFCQNCVEYTNISLFVTVPGKRTNWVIFSKSSYCYSRKE